MGARLSGALLVCYRPKPGVIAWFPSVGMDDSPRRYPDTLHSREVFDFGRLVKQAYVALLLSNNSMNSDAKS